GRAQPAPRAPCCRPACPPPYTPPLTIGLLRSARRVPSFFFFNDPATPEISTLSLHDALPISSTAPRRPPTLPARCSASSPTRARSEEHTSELQSLTNLVCRLLLEKKKKLSSIIISNNASTPENCKLNASPSYISTTARSDFPL